MKKKPIANQNPVVSPLPFPNRLRAAGTHSPVESSVASDQVECGAPDGELEGTAAEPLYTSADEAGLKEAVEDIWQNRPTVLFTDLCSCAIMTLESVAATYWESERQSSEDLPIADLCPNVDRFRHFLAIAKAIWESQHLYRYLTQPEVIRASKFEHSRSRFDGCCFHELAVRFGEDLIGGIDNGRTSRNYAAMLRFFTARGDFVTDYLQSLRADIRCESAADLEKWRAELMPASNLANQANRNRLFPKGTPEDPDVVDVVLRIDNAKGSGRSKLDIAREFFNENQGNDPKSKALLARIRMMKTRGIVNLAD